MADQHTITSEQNGRNGSWKSELKIYIYQTESNCSTNKRSLKFKGEEKSKWNICKYMETLKPACLCVMCFCCSLIILRQKGMYGKCWYLLKWLRMLEKGGTQYSR